MKQFKTILSFELNNYFRNKVFVGVTVFLMAAIAIAMFFPRISEAISSDKGEEAKPVMLVSADELAYAAALEPVFAAAFEDYDVRLADGDIASAVEEGEAECGFSITGLTSYTYYVGSVSLYDTNEAVVTQVLTEVYRATAMAEAGLPLDRVNDIMSREITGEVVSIGEDKSQNFLYTYVMVIVLYMVIMLYGQMVAQNVAAEKSSRAMELLITSAKPVSMMFGKVIASGLAGLCQLLAVFGSAFLFFNVNRSFWAGNALVESLFDIPAELLIYMLVFFIFGFFIYAFLYGAVGSTVSKTEDVGTASMPITMGFIVVYMVVIFSLSEGSIDNIAMKICSFFPLTSPMAMFARIAMSTVPLWERLLSVGILAVSVLAVGVIAAKIYRVGVLMYGNRPKPKELFKAIKKA